MFTSLQFNNGINREDVYSWINEHYNGLKPHYGKTGNNVRLFGDTPFDRCEIWETKNGYDMFIGLGTPLKNVAESLLYEGWSERYKGLKSKNEIALHNLTNLELDFMLQRFKKEEEKPITKEEEKPKTKRKSKARKEATAS